MLRWGNVILQCVQEQKKTTSERKRHGLGRLHVIGASWAFLKVSDIMEIFASWSVSFHGDS